MKIHEIKFTNFRAFESFQMEFEEQATVIVGRNGTGKSTILDGIAIALGRWIEAFRGRVDRFDIDEDDARLVAVEHAGVPTTEIVLPVTIEALGVVKRKPISWTSELQAVKRTHSEWSEDYASLMEESLRIASRLKQGKPVVVPVIAYYRTQRLWIGGTTSKRSKNGATSDELQSRTWGYDHALTAGSDRKGFEQWMAWREADRVQRLAQAIEEGKDTRDVKSPQLAAVEAAAAACLEGAKRFYYSANHRELRIDFDKGPSIPFKSLSDGQKNIIAVAADIAWRAAQLNPHLGDKVALETPGIVLIDELDLHLHPAWQMRVLDDLMRAFPKVQFIVTTHSPQIMSAAPPHSVRLLDTAHTVHRVNRLRGRDTNSILEDILDVPERPLRWKKKLEELARLIEDESLDAADQMLIELEKDEFYTDDPALVAARWELALARGDHAQD